MDDLQRGLYLDLKRRCTLLQTRMAKALADPDLKAHAQYASDNLRTVKHDIDQILLLAGSGTTSQSDAEKMAKLYGLNLRNLSRKVSVIQSYLVPPIERFSEHDRRMTRYVRKLGEQIHWPGEIPLVVTNSDSGYMTYTGFYLIEVPAAEDESLLGLPDLVHEMGHILLEENRDVFLNDFQKTLAKYVTSVQKGPQASKVNPDLYDQWASNWVREFVSDMVAAYVTGAPFGYQHIRLCSSYPPRAFHGAVSHPADDSRARGAIAVYRAMGDQVAATDVADRWQKYLATTTESKPATYDLEVPDLLVDALAKNVVDACKKLGIRPYTAPQLPANDAVGMMQEAWTRFHSNPDAFEKWEEQRLQQLWTELGLQTNPVQGTKSRNVPRPKKPAKLTRCGRTPTVIMNLAKLLDAEPLKTDKGNDGLAA